MKNCHGKKLPQCGSHLIRLVDPTNLLQNACTTRSQIHHDDIILVLYSCIVWISVCWSFWILVISNNSHFIIREWCPSRAFKAMVRIGAPKTGCKMRKCVKIKEPRVCHAVNNNFWIFNRFAAAILIAQGVAFGNFLVAEQARCTNTILIGAHLDSVLILPFSFQCSF